MYAVNDTGTIYNALRKFGTLEFVRCMGENGVNGVTRFDCIYRYFLFPLKKSEMKIGKATYFLFSIDNLQTKIGKGLKLPFTHFHFNIVK